MTHADFSEITLLVRVVTLDRATAIEMAKERLMRIEAIHVSWR